MDLCDPNDNVSVLYAVSVIVLGLFSIANDKDPEPGTAAYLNLREYLTILLNAYKNSPPDVQEHYRQFDPKFNFYDELINLLNNNQPLTPQNSKSSSKSGCFIATAVYGSPYANEVIILKEFRDKWLLNFRLGEIFVTFYYLISPPIANQIAKRESLRAFTKSTLIIPLIKIANHLKRKKN